MFQSPFLLAYVQILLVKCWLVKFYFSWWNAYPARWILISICENQWKVHGWHRWRWAWWTWERKSTFVVAWVCRCWEWWRTCASPCRLRERADWEFWIGGWGLCFFFWPLDHSLRLHLGFYSVLWPTCSSRWVSYFPGIKYEIVTTFFLRN